MTQNIVPKAINFKELVKNSNTTLSLDVQTKMVGLMNEEFTESQQQWYIANLYVYMNYHPTNDFPINLANVFKMIGFANKGNAKRTLENNFTKDEDYKVALFHTEKRKNEGGHNKEDIMLNVDTFIPSEKLEKQNIDSKAASPYGEAGLSTKNLGGAGLNEEQIMLNVDTFKNLCMIAKTEKGKEIRKYYVKLENIYNKIIKEEIENQKKITSETTNKLQLLELENQEKQDKINLLTRKTNKFELGESVYIFHSTIDNLDLYKVGRTKNANVRDAIHKTASYKGILLQIKCVDCVLLERVVHFLLNKYRCANRREWFNCSYDIVKNSIDYAKLLLESDINFTNSNLIDDTSDFIDTIKHSTNLNENENENNTALPTITNDIFTTIQFQAKDINNFDQFLKETCEIDVNTSLSYTTIKNQYKIWSKTAKHLQLKTLIEYLKKNYTTSMKRYNPLVSTSKLTPHFNGLKLKQSLLEFEKPHAENNVIENFLYNECQRAPGYRITMQDFFLEFEKWYIDYYNKEFTHIIKETVKKYFDIQFIRLRTGDESNGKDGRLGGWLGFALKRNKEPEPIKNYKPKNAKTILQINSSNQEIINTWSSLSELSDYIKRSRSVTSSLVQRHEQIYIDNILCILQYK
jgi:phage anti-repressor protein